ncbi:MAG: GntR family transcriptional regulator [Bacteroidales bacterium]|nr:GntR family transcriptional regulator [Fournierella massiliensis]MCF2555940.1 GntR family transcriptional regulator [Fournierella massiliensis]MCI6740249.1 GntR family transcriptional regulator [Bacteroidales bacterium]
MITLDYQSKDPIYLQIKNRIAELVMLGVYPPGTQLPSVRSLAGELGINPNTIQKAYQELETAGITCSVSGKGSFVAGEGGARDILKGRAETKLREALRQARLAGIRKEQAAQWVEQEYEGGGKP